jgi:hypothetical protein
MFLKTSALFIFLFISQNVFSQVEFIDNLTNWMADWETTYKPSPDVTCKETLNIDWAYHNRFIKFDIVGGWVEHPIDKYYTTEYITFNQDKQIAGFYMDNAGYDQLAAISGKLDGDKVILKLSSKTDNYEEIWEYKDGKLYRTHKWTDKETGKPSKIEVVFTRK